MNALLVFLCHVMYVVHCGTWRELTGIDCSVDKILSQNWHIVSAVCNCSLTSLVCRSMLYYTAFNSLAG